MADRVKRFAFEGFQQRWHDGNWVRYSDYRAVVEKLEDDRDRLGEAADQAVSELKAVEAEMPDQVERFRLHPLRNSGYQLVSDPEGEYMRVADCVGPEDYYDALSAAESRISDLEAERAQARKQVLEEVARYFEYLDGPGSSEKGSYVDAAAYCREQATNQAGTEEAGRG